ncbi:hypothetical protein [Streptomyces sp. N35]|uniref:hypothetical protein n=1 Tax=Streptomyces sp. N35 TaxID=2795730 RepID=UPI0018F71101|nr:hypothetical protein [Streptomyces sp. N35]
MTDVLTPPDLATIDVEVPDPLSQLLNIAKQAPAPSPEQERDTASLTAADHVYEHYTKTLGEAFCEAFDWHGLPSIPARDLEPSAIAELRDGSWLHHTVDTSYDGSVRHILTLLVPYDCGCGYRDIVLRGEDHLITVLKTYGPGDRVAATCDAPSGAIPHRHPPVNGPHCGCGCGRRSA